MKISQINKYDMHGITSAEIVHEVRSENKQVPVARHFGNNASMSMKQINKKRSPAKSPKHKSPMKLVAIEKQISPKHKQESVKIEPKLKASVLEKSDSESEYE